MVTSSVVNDSQERSSGGSLVELTEEVSLTCSQFVVDRNHLGLSQDRNSPSPRVPLYVPVTTVDLDLV